MRKPLALLAALLMVAPAVAQTNASVNPYVKLVSVTACYYVSDAEGGGNVWLPAIQVKFIPKQDFRYVEISGTFIDAKNSESLGKDMDNETELEAGVAYTFLLHSSTGWGNPYPNRPIKITPKFSFSGNNLYDKEIKISPVTKFPPNECKRV